MAAATTSSFVVLVDVALVSRNPDERSGVKFSSDAPTKTGSFHRIRSLTFFSFGVGFDACEVCGNAGYYERGSQVVCKRCDVVMNINTIGFKGGCNPIPLAYEVNGGNLVFRLEDLLAGEKEFR